MSVTVVVNVDEADKVTLPIQLCQKYANVNVCKSCDYVCKSCDYMCKSCDYMFKSCD